MNITFQIRYLAQFGQTLCIIDGQSWTEQHPLRLHCQGTDFWTVCVTTAKISPYRYAVRTEDGNYMYEAGSPRMIAGNPQQREWVVNDCWQEETEEQVFLSSVFTNALFQRIDLPKKIETTNPNLTFSIAISQLLPTQEVGALGNAPELGNWNPQHMLRLAASEHNSLWTGSVHVDKQQVIEYKYCIFDHSIGKIVDLEYGENRQIWDFHTHTFRLQQDNHFRRTQPRFRGAGVAIPVFSLRTNTDFGIGEFLDLRPLADWCSQVGMKIIQVLPINDTTLTHTALDSYPYKSVSVFALHPIYLHIPAMGKLSDVEQKRYETEQRTFQRKSYVDYQHVYDAKMWYYEHLFTRDWKSLSTTEAYHAFAEENQDWLPDYATFMAKRDGKHRNFYCYLQYHADRQLREAVQYVHYLGIALKGDIPIGVSRESVDVTVHPELFNVNASAGAPPDAFSMEGQNWGFPTYRWEQMQKDGYAWWTRRLKKMSAYFDAYRIDHILGFFRIWQMRQTEVWGLCGHFEPALPYSLQELRLQGVQLDEDRLTRPYIRSTFLEQVLGADTAYACKKFLLTDDGYVFYFRREVDTQKKLTDWFLVHGKSLRLPTARREALYHALMTLLEEVLFVRDCHHPELLHPRILMEQSYTFQELYDDQKAVLRHIYADYFFHRHHTFWAESAMRKLPTLLAATSMMCCGEDLGMVPDCVPEVMQHLHILSLEVERMPKKANAPTADPKDAPYLSVCTTGTHDMSTLRGWWQEEHARPITAAEAEDSIVRHLYSPAMWTILPLQDWLAIDERLWRKDVEAERINIPANPRHIWRYRMHIPLERLRKANAYNQHLRQLLSVRR